jgi:predicted nucleic acid-binding Zn ribbon protein
MRNFGAPEVATVRSVFDRWSELVGDQVAQHATPASLRDGVLTVAVEDPAWATQLRFLEAQLLTRIAELFGTDEVTSIVIRVRRGDGSRPR